MLFFENPGPHNGVLYLREWCYLWLPRCAREFLRWYAGVVPFSAVLLSFRSDYERLVDALLALLFNARR